MKFEKYLITHPDWGVFLGSAFGMAFWSRMDPAGQDQAVCFDSEGMAEDYIESWSSIPDGVQIVPVHVSDSSVTHATIDECESAGVSRWAHGEAHLQISVKGEMAAIIEKAERLIIDAEAKGDEDWLMRIGTMLQCLAHAASRRAGAVKHKSDGSEHRSRVFIAASRDAVGRAVATLDDDGWKEWQGTGKPPTPEIVVVKPENGAANDTIAEPDDGDPLLH